MLGNGLELGHNCIDFFLFGEVYRLIYGGKFSFTATRERSRETRFPNVNPTIYLPK